MTGVNANPTFRTILTRMARPRHPNADIEAALQYAEDQGWVVEKAGPRAHPWGKIMCTQRDRDGCTTWIYSTPSVPERHARGIKRAVDRCPH